MKSVIMAKKTGSTYFRNLFPKVTDANTAIAPKGAKLGGCGRSRLTATSVIMPNKVEVVFLVIAKAIQFHRLLKALKVRQETKQGEKGKKKATFKMNAALKNLKKLIWYGLQQILLL